MKWSPLRPRVAAVAAVSLVSALGLSACSSDDSDPRPLVVAAFGPLAWATEQVAGDDFRVQNLAAPGVEAHDLDPSVRQMADIEKAEVVVLMKSFQPAVDSAAANVAEGTVLDVTQAARLVPPGEHEADHTGHDHSELPDNAESAHEDHDHAAEDHADEEHADEEHGDTAEHADDHAESEFASEHDGHDHGDVDPHFWQDPLRLADVVDAIADTLATARPEQKQVYAERAAAVRAQLKALDSEYRTGLSACARETVVVSHEAFGYLTTYGLHFEAINGLSPGAEPTPADLARLQQLIRTDGITTVFSEENATKKLAQTLASDTGVTTAVLDPLESLPSGGDYLTIMKSNLRLLQKANACR